MRTLARNDRVGLADHERHHRRFLPQHRGWRLQPVQPAGRRYREWTHWWWADDQTDAPRQLGPGLYGLSNAALDAPWPKVQWLKSAVAAALDDCASFAALEAELFAALADRSPVADDDLPDTGVGLDRERWLAPAFIRTPDAQYGTRCSTLLIVERHATGLSARMVERLFDADSTAPTQRAALLAHWPLLGGGLPPVQMETVNAG